jgi:hypothetical protein
MTKEGDHKWTHAHTQTDRLTCRLAAAPDTHSCEWRSLDHDALDEAETDVVGGGEDHDRRTCYHGQSMT